MRAKSYLSLPRCRVQGSFLVTGRSPDDSN
jgi:hypothetical protein